MTQINWQYQVNNRAGGYIVTATDWNDLAGNFRAFIDQTTGSGTTDNSPLPIGIDLVNDRVYISDPDSTTPENANHADTTFSVVGDSTFVGAVTVGVDDTGHDVKLFGATAGSHLLWDESADELHLVSTSKSAYLVSKNGTAQAYLGVDSANTALFGTSTAHTTRFITNNTERMTILSDGKIGIGDTTPARLFQVTEGDSGCSPSVSHHVLVESDDDMGVCIASGNTKNGYLRFGDDGSAASGGFNYDHNDNSIKMRTNGTDYFSMGSAGLVRMTRAYTATTGNSANLWVDTDGGIYRSTSSIKFKTDIETMEDKYADAVLELRPVWYRSTATADRQDWSHWGLIAEEVEAIDPRLVYYGPEPELDSDGNHIFEETDSGSVPLFKKDADGKVIQEPQGVQYDRLVPHLLNIIKRLDTRVKALEAS